jgi:hypothetical protein
MAFDTETGFRAPTTIGQVILFITFLVNSWLNVRREKRLHQWHIEEAALIQANLERRERETQNKLDAQTKEIKDSLQRRTDEISKHFDSLLEDRK